MKLDKNDSEEFGVLNRTPYKALELGDTQNFQFAEERPELLYPLCHPLATE